jgi:hypothetical protein
VTPQAIARASAEAMWSEGRASRALGMSLDDVGQVGGSFWPREDRAD